MAGAVLADLDTAPVSPRLRALLRIAAEVRGPVRPVAAGTVTAARAAGADDRQIHDVVLIAAAFCLYNRYVTALDTELPQDPGYFEEAAKRITARGYAARS